MNPTDRNIVDVLRNNRDFFRRGGGGGGEIGGKGQEEWWGKGVSPKTFCLPLKMFLPHPQNIGQSNMDITIKVEICITIDSTPPPPSKKKTSGRKLEIKITCQNYSKFVLLWNLLCSLAFEYRKNNVITEVH